jgi:hypothetical protein
MEVVCPLCRNRHGTKANTVPSNFDGQSIQCECCGSFKVTRVVLADQGERLERSLTEVQRVCLMRAIRRSQSNKKIPVITSQFLSDFQKSARLPTPPELARGIIEILGDEYKISGQTYTEVSIQSIVEVGFFDDGTLVSVIKNMEDQGLIDDESTMDGTTLSLTLRGWREYDALQKGLRPGRFGFLAMKFNDPVLEKFCEDVVRPIVKEALGYDVIDLREVSRAGVIDNILREQIRDSAFLLADLTHDNSGAYWEAGYAEGLGKPVIYLCEREKFEEAQTHFDTNHCTTIIWSAENGDAAGNELVATIRRSLSLFE